MSEGVFRRCGCTEVVDGKRRELGAQCPKLENRKHGTWWFQIDVAPLPGTGKKRRRVRRGGFATSTEASTERSKIAGKGQTAAQRRIPNDQVTVAEFLRRWLASRRKKAATITSYRGHIEKYLIPYLGHHKAVALSIVEVREAFDAIEEVNKAILANRARQKPLKRGQPAPEGYETRKPMGSASMQRLRATARAAWNSELAAELGITSNPFAALELASGKPPKPMLWTAARVARWQVTGEVPGKVMVWPPVQLGAFLDHAYVEDPRHARLYDLVAHTGMRRGEGCGLRWTDVDTTAKVLHIEEQLTLVDWKVVADTPKSEHSQRTIPLSAAVLAILKDQEQVQDAEEKEWGSAWLESGRVFTSEGGEALHPDTVSDRFRELVESSGLPPITLHGLRHCAGTLGLAAGLDIKVVQELLGHSSSRITSDTYTNVLEDMSTAAVEAISALIPRRNGGTEKRPAGTDGTEMEPKAERAPSDGARSEENSLVSDSNSGAPEGIRTPNLLIRRSTPEVPAGDE